MIKKRATDRKERNKKRLHGREVCNTSGNKKPPLAAKRQLQMRKHCTCRRHLLACCKSKIYTYSNCRACELIFSNDTVVRLFSILFYTANVEPHKHTHAKRKREIHSNRCLFNTIVIVLFIRVCFSLIDNDIFLLCAL